MKKILIICFFCCLTHHAFAAAEKRNYTKDGVTCYAELSGLYHYYVACYDQNNKKIREDWGDNNTITYDNNGNVINQHFHHDNRLTFVLNEQGQIVSRKSPWNGPIDATYSYTSDGKILVFGTDGKLNGAYNDVFEYYLWDMSFKKNPPDYIDNMNKISEDGNFYDLDSEGNIIKTYYPNGESKKFSANGDYILYDKKGNNLGSFMADGTKRRIYTVDEALAVVKKGSKNTFKINYK